MSLMERFSDPALFDSLSFGEKMMGSLITMIMGMGITFCVLAILWGFVSLMGKALGRPGKKRTKEEAAADAAPSAAAAAVDTASAAEAEVVAAVIAAAIEAYRAEGGMGSLKVRKITRLSGEHTPWSNAAIDDCIKSRRF